MAIESGAISPLREGERGVEQRGVACAGRRPTSSRNGKKTAESIRITLAKAAARVRSMAPRRLVIITVPQRWQRRRPPCGTGAAACSMSQVGQASMSAVIPVT